MRWSADPRNGDSRDSGLCSEGEVKLAGGRAGGCAGGCARGPRGVTKLHAAMRIMKVKVETGALELDGWRPRRGLPP